MSYVSDTSSQSSDNISWSSLSEQKFPYSYENLPEGDLKSSEIYHKLKQIRSNIKNNHNQLNIKIQPFQFNVDTLHQSTEDIFIASSHIYNGGVAVEKMTSPADIETLFTLQGQGTVFKLKPISEQLCVWLSIDGKHRICIWDPKTSTFIFDLVFKNEEISNFEIEAGILNILLTSGEIRHYSLESYSLETTSQIPGNFQKSQFVGDYLHLELPNFIFEIWDFKTETKIGSIYCLHDDPIEDFQVYKNCIYTLDQKGILKKWDLQSKECLLTIDARENEVASAVFSKLCLANDFLYVGSEDSMLKVFDCHTGKKVKILQWDQEEDPHRIPIITLSANNNRLAIGGMRYVKFWNFEKNSSS